ncbi:MAG TPA: zf-HC2 domain-containing protein [Candidatus Eisenbacteria bacterium]|nr:zf-HC2 domain-containing protein [Candidatus Eisenbacteria bacterium]
MSCRKAYELDLAGFLADPTGAVWAEFRDHYPRCPACAAEVRAWTELHLALGSGSHPDPDDLVRYVDGGAALAPTTRHAIAEHLAACAACRDEAHTLRTFDPLSAPAAERTPRPRRSFAFPSIGRILWHPAFAYAVALLAVLYPTLSGRVTAPTAVVEQEKRSIGGPARHVLADEEAAPAKTRQPEAPAGAGGGKPAAAPAPSGDEYDLRKEADTPAPAATALGYVARDKLAAAAKGDEGLARNDAEQKSKPAEPEQMRSRAQATTPEILIAAGEPTIVIAPGAGDVILRIEDAPPGAAAAMLHDAGGVRTFVARRESASDADAGRPAFRFPSRLLTPGRYALTFASKDGEAGERHFRVTAP